MIQGKDFVQKLYSTGDEMLDNLLERAFCEGYELAQREFARRDYEGLTPAQQAHLKNKRDNAAEFIKDEMRHVRKLIDKDLQEYPSQIEGRTKNTKGAIIGLATETKPTDKGYLGVRFNYGGDESSRVWRKKGQSLESYKQDRIKQAYSDIENSLDKVKHQLKEQVIEDVDDLNKQYEGKSIPEYLVTKPTKRSSSFNRTKKQVGNFIKDHKGAVIGGTLGTAALVGGGIALHKRNKKKKEKK